MEDLITIIIPIYQVEKYLRKCLDSVLNQTYKNLEIILIDDGSKDNSSQICEEYKKKDTRIKVIHKNNEGTAEARNDGLKIATGKYIGFVDSDDYIKSDMYQILHENMIKTNADISICNMIQVKENSNIDSIENITNKQNLIQYNKEEALKLLIENEIIKSYPWDKLFKKEILEGIQFPKGKKMEDLAIMYKILEKATNIVYTDKIEYYYLQRSNSTLGNINLKLTEDLWYFITERYQYMMQHYPELKETLDLDRVKYILIYHKNFCIINEKQKYNQKRLVKEYDFFKENFKKYKNSIYYNITLMQKLEYNLLYISRKAFWNYYKLKRIGKKVIKRN